ncbi:hypothetical protein HHK36_025605 [Tetracentron sinense]|uniref:Uncharacterized protein n=1 Tax=Tetracentron sinense TaxID=13715 RepID=A0A835D371_TETSI|nr:hypothetical protein HHK36_025605 [Tetracentron sinense]
MGLLVGFLMAAFRRLKAGFEIDPKRDAIEEEEEGNREEAVDIVQKMESNEASNKFIEGLIPVVSIEGMEQKIERSDQLHKLVESKESAQVIETPCVCSCTSASVDESPEKAKLREPLSAPF